LNPKPPQSPVRSQVVSAEARAEQRFGNLLEAAPDGILEVDQEGNITLLNQAAEKMFGYTRDELLGLKVEKLVPDAVRPQHTSHRAKYTSHAQVRPMGSGLQLRAQRKDGSLFPVEISLSPNKVDGEFHVIALIRDISERKQTEDRLREIREQYTEELAEKNQELERRNREIEQANHLKSEFMASMSHELRTPLHTIIGFAELLTEEIEGPLNEKQTRFVGHILRDSGHLLELINEVLDLSKIEAGRMVLQLTSFGFSECVQEVLAGVQQRALAKEIKLERRAMYDGPLHADRLRIKEALYNLLSNAVKFTPNGGRVWIESLVQDDFLEVTVGDTGVGIPAEEHANIFEKFYQAGNTTGGVREGTGLGLPITKKLAEMHGGSISVKSVPRQGSEFMLRLPLVGRSTQPPAETSE
jgi:PAS domain S-box-containing protein